MTSQQRCVVAGGSGAVGRMFANLLRADGADVCVVDPVPPGHTSGLRHLAGDITRPDDRVQSELRRADLVMVATPAEPALAAIGALAGQSLADGALVAHTLSVQSPAADVLRRCLPGRPAVGLNPLFAPALGLAGHAVAAVIVQDGHGISALLDLIARSGATVFRTDADSHDRHTACTQVLTHATVLTFGLALAELEADPRAPAPPPFRLLMSLLARIASGTPEVYADIQSQHPMAAQVRNALADAAAQIAAAAHDAQAFRALLERARGAPGAELELYAQQCADIFRSLATRENTPS